MIVACTGIMREFKDGKSREWNPYFWIRLWQGHDDEQAKEELEAMVDGDRVKHGQVADASPSTSANACGRCSSSS